MNMVDAGYACGVLVTLAGGLLLGVVVARAGVAELRTRVAAQDRALQAVAQLALDHGATPAQLEQHIGRDATARLCWQAATVEMRAVDRPRLRSDPPHHPRFAGGRQAVVKRNGRQEAPMQQTRPFDARELRQHLDGGR